MNELPGEMLDALPGETPGETPGEMPGEPDEQPDETDPPRPGDASVPYALNDERSGERAADQHDEQPWLLQRADATPKASALELTSQSP